MTAHHLSTLTVCGIPELDSHTTRGVTDVLSILDPAMPDPAGFANWPAHRRTILRFHDDIAERPGVILPGPHDIAAILDYGDKLSGHPGEKHLLVHCHMGLSRSTAALATLLAQAEPETDADEIFGRIHAIRPQAWPNSLMVRMADDALGRDGALLMAMRRLHGRQVAAFPTFAQGLRSIGRGEEIDMAIAV
jgi:predicted protein tyrosine phosphatase